MKKTLSRRDMCIGMAAVLLSPGIFLSGCGGERKPDNMDQKTYDLGCEAVTVGENYLSSKTSGDDAYKKLDSIYRQLDAYVPDNSTSHLLVKSAVLNMRSYVDPIVGANRSKFSDALDRLKEVLKG